MIPDEIKEFALELNNIRSLIYIGYPADKESRSTGVPTKQLLRFIHLEKRLSNFMRSQLGDFWEADYLSTKSKSKRIDQE